LISSPFPYTTLFRSELEFLRDVYQKAGPEWHARAAHIATLQRAFNDAGARFAENELEQVLPAIARYLTSGAIRGWMFTANVASRDRKSTRLNSSHT